MRIHLAVFDMIGTTIQAGDEVPSAFRRAFSGAGIALTDEGISGIRGRSKHDSILELLAAHDVPPARRHEMAGVIYQRFQDYLRSAYESCAQPIEGTENVFEFLRGVGVQVALTTGLDRDTGHVLLQSLGWEHLGLAGLITGDDVLRGRPAPDLILAAMRLARVEEPGRVLVAGDTSADLEAAAAAGVGLSIGVLTGAHSLGRLRTHPHSAILESVADLPQWLSKTGAVQKRSSIMSGIKERAERFFDACETGKGWEACREFCHPDATFSAQAGALAEVKTVEAYTEWMKGLFTPVPDGRYELRSFAVDEARNNVSAFAVFHGTHTAEGGPVPPTGKSVAADYVYVMDFDGDRIRHVTKVWNDANSLQQLGWM